MKKYVFFFLNPLHVAGPNEKTKWRCSGNCVQYRHRWFRVASMRCSFLQHAMDAVPYFETKHVVKLFLSMLRIHFNFFNYLLIYYLRVLTILFLIYRFRRFCKNNIYTTHSNWRSSELVRVNIIFYEKLKKLWQTFLHICKLYSRSTFQDENIKTALDANLYYIKKI